jgi:hypothetical protein
MRNFGENSAKFRIPPNLTDISWSPVEVSLLINQKILSLAADIRLTTCTKIKLFQNGHSYEKASEIFLKQPRSANNNKPLLRCILAGYWIRNLEKPDPTEGKKNLKR